jgi:chromatin structure-remodeling complex subunit RSC1/2
VYGDLDQFVKDMELMFDNAKAFNEDDSQLYKDAVLLQKELRKAALTQKAITDEELAGTEDGFAHGKNVRIPLDKIEHKGEIYKVGMKSVAIMILICGG